MHRQHLAGAARRAHRHLDHPGQAADQEGVGREVVGHQRRCRQHEAQADDVRRGDHPEGVDTPGRDDVFARHLAPHANTLVTPMNDSFVDFDLIGQVDAETFKVKKLSFYAELIWEARLKRSRMGLEQQRRELDWVVVRNRTGYTEARNMARLEKALAEMSKRVGFRVAKGLSERVIYRELFPSGLTLLDKGHLGDLGTSHLVARQELRGLIANLRLPGPGSEDAVPAAR